MNRGRTRSWTRPAARAAGRLAGNRGAALLITVVLTFLLLAFLGTWILGGTYTFLSGAHTRARALQARCLARSGLEWARTELQERSDLDGDGRVGQIGSPDGSVRRSFGGGSLWVQATGQGKNLVLTAYGSYQETTQRVRSIEENPWQDGNGNSGNNGNNGKGNK